MCVSPRKSAAKGRVPRSWLHERPGAALKYLLLGGAGFHGRHLAEKILAKGDEVRIFDRYSLDVHRTWAQRPGIEWMQAEFDDALALEGAIRGVEVVFHLISTTLPKSSNDDPVHDVLSNVIPTLRLLDALRYAKVSKIVYFSSG